MSFSVEAECGYIPKEIGDGGNFSGVCLGLDRAVSLYNTLIPKVSCKTLGFYVGVFRNTRKCSNLPR